MKRRRDAVALALAGAALAAGCAPAGSAARAPTAAPGGAQSGGPQSGGAQSGGETTRQLAAQARLAPCPVTPAEPGGRRAGGLPSLTLACLGGGPPVRLAAVRGTPALVNLWASWCAPCKQEAPELQRVHAAAGSKLRVLGVLTDDDERNGLAAARGVGLHYASVVDTDGRVRRALGIAGPPVTLFVSADGMIRHRVYGVLPAGAALDALIEAHLAVRL